MFGVVVGKVFVALAPVDKEVALTDAVSYPIETHVHGLGAALFDGVVADAGGTCVVGLDGSGWLGVSHVLEDGSEHGGFLAIVEEGCEFCFGGGGEDRDEDGGENVYGAVVWWWGSVGRWYFGGVGETRAHVEVAACSGACVFLGEVGGVAVDMKNHVAGVETKGGIRMGGGVVQELGDGDGGGFGAVVLLGGKGAKGDEHGAVDGPGVVEEGADDFLEAFELSGVEWRGIVGGCGVLNGGSVGWWCPGVWGVLGTSVWGVGESVDGLGDVAGH